MPRIPSTFSCRIRTNFATATSLPRIPADGVSLYSRVYSTVRRRTNAFRNCLGRAVRVIPAKLGLMPKKKFCWFCAAIGGSPPAAVSAWTALSRHHGEAAIIALRHDNTAATLAGTQATQLSVRSPCATTGTRSPWAVPGSPDAVLTRLRHPDAAPGGADPEPVRARGPDRHVPGDGRRDGHPKTLFAQRVDLAGQSYLCSNTGVGAIDRLGRRPESRPVDRRTRLNATGASRPAARRRRRRRALRARVMGERDIDHRG
jgi:hypothetical protein